MIPAEWLKKIRRIELRTIRLVENMMAGQYHSVFKGRGLDFEEVREYQVGDDVRAIDWNVTARTGLTYIKQYVEEREMTVMLLVDASASGAIGSVRQSKRELAAELAAVLAFSAIHNNDKVGLLMFTDHAEYFAPPAKGRTHVLAIVSAILTFQPKRRGTNLAAALRYVGHALHRRAVVFVISDFLDAGFERALKITGRKHDLVAVPVRDAAEKQLPVVGWIVFEDAESGEVLEINTADPQARCVFATGASGRADQLRQLFRQAGLDAIEVETDQPYLKALMKFFRRRHRRLHP